MKLTNSCLEISTLLSHLYVTVFWGADTGFG